jgi:hypothetical protein
VNAFGGAEAGAGAAGARGIIEGEIAVMERRGKQAMFVAAEIFPESLSRPRRESFGMEPEEAIPTLRPCSSEASTCRSIPCPMTNRSMIASTKG